MSGSEPADRDTATGTEVGTETERLPVLEPEEYPTVRRTEHLAEQRRHRRRVGIAALSAALAVLAAGVVAIPLLARQGSVTSTATADDETALTAGSVGDATTLLLVSHPDEPDAAADSITLFAVDPASDRGAVLFLPADLLVELPGIGLERLGNAQHYEGIGLVSETVADVLDVDVTASTALADEELGELLGAAGPLTVDVGPEPLTAAGEGREPVRFEPGEQALDGDELVRYWTARGEREQALADLARKQQVVTALLERVEEDPDVLGDTFGSGGIELGARAEPAVVRGVLTELAAALAADQLGFGALPVRTFGGTASDGSAVVALSQESQTILSSLLVGVGDEDATRVEVRDASGNRDLVGRVEGAHRVEEALGDDFRVQLGAATEEQVAETEIVIYADTSELREQAEAVRAALGLGTISVEEQPQTAVDVTIRLADDFLAAAP